MHLGALAARPPCRRNTDLHFPICCSPLATHQYDPRSQARRRQARRATRQRQSSTRRARRCSPQRRQRRIRSLGASSSRPRHPPTAGKFRRGSPVHPPSRRALAAYPPGARSSRLHFRSRRMARTPSPARAPQNLLTSTSGPLSRPVRPLGVRRRSPGPRILQSPDLPDRQRCARHVPLRTAANPVVPEARRQQR